MMNSAHNQSNASFDVVANDEGQYSIWPAAKAIPAGWHLAGKSASKEECLAYIAEVWTDMRPLSLRTQMDNLA
jgi:MbtH protein